jgi:DegV family protein with EDD domain
MGSVGVVTDSSACLPTPLPVDCRVTVLPITVHLPDEDVRDGAPGASEKIYRAVGGPEPVPSSAPIVPDYLTAIEESEADEVLVVTPALEFTTMYRHAEIAVEMSDRPAAVLDSRTAAAAQGLVVLEACAAAGEGLGLEAVVKAAEHASRHAELVAKIESLDPILRSGRIPTIAARLARGMDLRPIFRLVAGSVAPVHAARSTSAALNRIAREWKERGGPDATRSLVFHAESPDDAGALRALLGGNEPIVEFSPSIGVHTGPGVAGAAWLSRG